MLYIKFRRNSEYFNQEGQLVYNIEVVNFAKFFFYDLAKFFECKKSQISAVQIENLTIIDQVYLWVGNLNFFVWSFLNLLIFLTDFMVVWFVLKFCVEPSETDRAAIFQNPKKSWLLQLLLPCKDKVLRKFILTAPPAASATSMFHPRHWALNSWSHSEGNLISGRLEVLKLELQSRKNTPPFIPTALLKIQRSFQRYT